MSLPFIKVDGTKLETIKSLMVFKSEEPLFLAPLEYRIQARKKNLRPGFLLVTRGAIYVLKTKFLKPPMLDKKLHILNILKMKIDLEQVDVDFQNFHAEFKMKYGTQFYEAVQTVLSEVTYGIPNYKGFEIESDLELPQILLKSRPQNAISLRILFFAHYYNIKGDISTQSSYFDKWEEKQKNMVVFGPSFYPGVSGTAILCAVGWEVLLETTVFQGCCPPHFPNLIQALLENSQNITKIAFVDYKDERFFPKFGDLKVSHTIVNRFWFMRDKIQIILDFCDYAKVLPQPIEEFMIVGTTITEQDLDLMTEKIKEAPALKNVRTLSIVRDKINPFPFNSFMNLLSVVNNLTTLTVRGLDSNASDIFTAVCNTPNRIKILNITHMQFRSPIIESAVLPPALISINLSFCAFVSLSFWTLMNLFVSKPHIVPFSLQMQSLVLKAIAYQALEQIDFSNACSNIAEIDWSGNTMPAAETRLFFAYLFTQKRLRYIKFDDMSAEDPVQFLKGVLQLTASLRVAGLDLSGRFEPNEIVQVMHAISYMKWLRRISLRNSMSGESGMKEMVNIIKSIPHLNEVLADGFGCSAPGPLFDMWNTINNAPELLASDFPAVDLKRLKLTLNDLNEHEKMIIEQAMHRKKTSTIDHRSMCVLDQMKHILEMGLGKPEEIAEKFSMISTNDIFKQTVEMGYVDNADDFDKDMNRSNVTPGHIDE